MTEGGGKELPTEIGFCASSPRLPPLISRVTHLAPRCRMSAYDCPTGPQRMNRLTARSSSRERAVCDSRRSTLRNHYRVRGAPPRSPANPRGPVRNHPRRTRPLRSRGHHYCCVRRSFTDDLHSSGVWGASYAAFVGRPPTICVQVGPGARLMLRLSVAERRTQPKSNQVRTRTRRIYASSRVVISCATSIES